jgi:hypothetical protein
MIRYTATRTARRVAAAAVAVAACFASVTMACAAAAPAVSQAAPAVSLVHSAGSGSVNQEHVDNTQWHNGGI